jgi:hypothetical protein
MTNAANTVEPKSEAMDVNNNAITEDPTTTETPTNATVSRSTNDAKSNGEDLNQPSPVHFCFNESEIGTSTEDTNDSFVTVYENDLDLSKEYNSNDDDNISIKSQSEQWYTPSIINSKSNDNTPISQSTPKPTCVLLGVPCTNDSAEGATTSSEQNQTGTQKQCPTINKREREKEKQKKKKREKI